MNLSWRHAVATDVSLLSEWNHQLIRDEGHRNAMTVEQLTERMRGWLKGEYQAVVFSNASNQPVAYALYKQEASQIYLRQFFVHREQRRLGIGRAAFAIIRRDIWPTNLRLTVDVLTRNTAAIAFWRSVGYKDYAVTLEIMPE